MKRRGIELISFLLTNRHVPQSTEDLSTWFSVSERTLRYDVAAINDYFHENGLDVRIVYDGRFVRMDGMPEDIASVSNLINRSDLAFYQLSAEERAILILMIILSKDVPYITIDTIMQKLGVSRTSVNGELPKVRKLCASLGLGLYSKTNKGFTIRNEELVLRKAIIRLFSEQVKNVNAAFFQQLQRVFAPAYSLEQISEICREMDESQYESSAKWHMFCLNAMVCVSRMQKGLKATEVEALNLPEDEQLSYDVFRYKALLHRLGLAPSKHELHNFWLLLYSQKAEQTPVQSKADLFIVVTRFLGCVSDVLHVPVSSDSLLLQNLVRHILSYINRRDTNLYNPHLTKIRSEYKPVIDAVRQNLLLISAYFDYFPDEHEISFVSMHICASIVRLCSTLPDLRVAVVCMEGVATAHLLVEQLNKYFSLRIAAVLSASELYSFPYDNEFDLIISSCTIPNSSVKTIEVNPILTFCDILLLYRTAAEVANTKPVLETAGGLRRRFSQLIDNCTRNMTLDTLAGELANLEERFGVSPNKKSIPLLDPSRILLHAHAATWQQAVELGGELLVRQGFVNPSYVYAMIESVRVRGPYYVITKGVALAHASQSSGVLDTGLALCILKEPVTFGHEEFDPVQIIFSLSVKEDDNSIAPFLSRLITLCKNQETVDRLRNASSVEEIMDIIHY